MFKFKQQRPLEQRISESKKLRRKYPGKVPIIIQKVKNCDLPELLQEKYLVEGKYTVAALARKITVNLNLNKTDAIQIFCGQQLIRHTTVLSDLD